MHDALRLKQVRYICVCIPRSKSVCTKKFMHINTYYIFLKRENTNFGFFRFVYSFGEQGWRSGKSARLPPMWPGFDSRTRRHMWVEFVVSSRPCFEGFSPGPPSSKTNISKFQFDLEFEGHRFVSHMTVKCHPR